MISIRWFFNVAIGAGFVCIIFAAGLLNLSARANEEVDEILKKGDTLFEHHKFKEAEEQFRDAVASHPENARAHTKLGAVLAASALVSTASGDRSSAGNQYDTALLEEQTAMKLDPKYFLP